MSKTFLRFNSLEEPLEIILEKLMNTRQISAHPLLEYTFRLVCEEIVVNIMHYAYSEKEGSYLCLSVEDDGESVILEFRDGGRPFNPLTKALPDVSLPPEHREIGGLGIFLVREMMDEVTYTYVEGENRLRIKKRYSTKKGNDEQKGSL